MSPPMSSIPAAKERLADMAEFLEGDGPALIAAGVTTEHAADLRWSLAELSRLEEESAKLRAERDEALVALKPFADAAEMFAWPVGERNSYRLNNGCRLTVGDLRRAASLITKGGADDSKPRSVADIVAGWPSCSFCGRIFPQSFAPDCNVPECPSRAALQNKDERK